MSQVCKSFWYFIRADNFLCRKFVQKELWYKCATKPEKTQYINYRHALADQIKLDFVIGVGSTPRLSLNLNPKMSLGTLHLIVCAFGYFPPYKTTLTFQSINCSGEKQTSHMYRECLSDLKLFQETKCFKVEPIVMR